MKRKEGEQKPARPFRTQVCQFTTWTSGGQRHNDNRRPEGNLITRWELSWKNISKELSTPELSKGRKIREGGGEYTGPNKKGAKQFAPEARAAGAADSNNRREEAESEVVRA